MAHDHLEESIKNLLAFETHAKTDACPHCMTKHILLVQQLLEEEAQQNDGKASELVIEARRIKEELPQAYKGDLIVEDKMMDLERRAREIRLSLMKEAGVPGHKHLDRDREEEAKHILAG